jgi:amidase
VLMSPVLPSPADSARHFHAGHPLRSAWRSSLRTAYTTAWNVAGFPAASVPAGWTPDGLPLAVQLIALPGQERLLLSLAAELQRDADWTDRRPSV